jgi:serine/threonine-protein kinase
MPTRIRTLAGRYQLNQIIGRGGMSTVYRATDLMLDRTIAVKVLLAALADEDPTYIARFEREARAAAALTHRAVVTVYDAGVDEGERFIAMEYIDGRSLAEILRDDGPIEPEEAVTIAREVTGALAAAHSAGILHRDVKPANVMVTDDGAVKVLDFGVARPLDGTTLTQAASLVGTAAYMAPERALGKPGDARSDIYSLGCLLYAMLTGGPPFTGELSAAVLHQHINTDPRPPSSVTPRIPATLDAVVLGMLAKSPAARPQTAAEVRDRLAAVAGGRVGSAVPAAATGVTAPLEYASQTGVLRPRPTGAARRAVLAAVVTAGIALAAIALFGGGGSQTAFTSTHHSSTTGSHSQTTSRSALATSTQGTTPATTSQPPEQGGVPPGQGGQPPGQDKKHPGQGDGGD